MRAEENRGTMKLNGAICAETEWGILCWNWMRHFMLKLN